MKCQDLTANHCTTQAGLVLQISTGPMTFYQQLTVADNLKTSTSVRAWTPDVKALNLLFSF